MAKSQEVETPVGGDVLIIAGEKFPFSPELLDLKLEYDKLTTRQRAWFDIYITNRNASESARQAGYKGDDGTIRRMGKTNKDKMQHMIDIIDSHAKEVMQAVTELTGIYTFWGTTLVDQSVSMRDRLKASELLARALGAFDSETGDVNIFVGENPKIDEIPSDVLEAFIIANSNLIEGETVDERSDSNTNDR